jgi:chromate reductase, NAD(P)H dehydrogenase (quinone)
MPTSRILAFAGSARRDSFNKRLVRIAARGAEQAGAQVTLIDLKDYPLPIMDQDLEAEQGPPENALALKKMFLEHDGLLMSCPEYNSSITPLWKNTIDWVSRPGPGDPPMGLTAFKNKVAAIMSASPGGLGGLRGLVHVRSILSNIGVLVLPDQIAIGQAHNAFTDDGRLKDAQQQASVEKIAQSLEQVIAKLK